LAWSTLLPPMAVRKLLRRLARRDTSDQNWQTPLYAALAAPRAKAHCSPRTLGWDTAACHASVSTRVDATNACSSSGARVAALWVIWRRYSSQAATPIGSIPFTRRRLSAPEGKSPLPIRRANSRAVPTARELRSKCFLHIQTPIERPDASAG